ncbi:MAG: hypothetical protein ACOYOH_25130, partial [Paracraurococcus sp.]
PFAAVIGAMTGYLDRAAQSPRRDALSGLIRQRNFALGIEPTLRRLAEQGEMFRWIDQPLDRLRAGTVEPSTTPLPAPKPRPPPSPDPETR